MATRRGESDKVKKKPVAAGKKPAATTRKPVSVAPQPSAGAKGLLHASLKALGNVRDDVVMRQNNVIDSLLGMAPGKAGDPEAKGMLPRGLKALDPFGIRKFEDVFDQRVATALQHLGLPAAQEWQALRDEVKQLREQLARLQSPPAPKAPRKR